MRLTPAVVSAVLLLVPLSACGDDEPTPTPTPSQTTPSATPTEDAAPQSSADLVIAPGRIGPVEVGMSQDDAVGTGLFDADVEYINEACQHIDPLVWKPAFTGVDVLTTEDGTIVSMGTYDNGPHTENGISYGSTYAELIDAYGADLSAPEVAGYAQVGLYVQDGDDWLGFLIGEAESIDALDSNHDLEVTFIEVTEGEKPALLRDGC